jgi:cobalt/nickel transport system permease protein
VAADTGIAASGQEAGPALFADYATEGIGNETLSLAVAGASGAAITLLVGAGLFSAVRLQRPSDKVSA